MNYKNYFKKRLFEAAFELTPQDVPQFPPGGSPTNPSGGPPPPPPQPTGPNPFPPTHPRYRTTVNPGSRQYSRLKPNQQQRPTLNYDGRGSEQAYGGQF